MDFINDNTYNSVKSSSNTIKQQQQSSSSNKTQSVITFNQEDDSGIEQDSTILIRICINEQSLQVLLFEINRLNHFTLKVSKNSKDLILLDFLKIKIN
jgi:hypothetical protein